MKLATYGYVKPHTPREPLRSTAEVAEALGAPMAQMRRLLARTDAPEPALKNSKGGQYRLSEVTLWWNKRKAEEVSEKECLRCLVVKPVTEFYRVTKSGQLRELCKPCHNTYVVQMKAKKAAERRS
jgi:hypothetical protein